MQSQRWRHPPKGGCGWRFEMFVLLRPEGPIGLRLTGSGPGRDRAARGRRAALFIVAERAGQPQGRQRAGEQNDTKFRRFGERRSAPQAFRPGGHHARHRLDGACAGRHLRKACCRSGNRGGGRRGHAATARYRSNAARRRSDLRWPGEPVRGKGTPRRRRWWRRRRRRFALARRFSRNFFMLISVPCHVGGCC